MSETVEGGERQPRRLRDDYRPGTDAQRPARLSRRLAPRDAPRADRSRAVRSISGGMDDDTEIERMGAVDDLWGPLQWHDPDDFLPPRLLEELRERASLMQEVAGRSRDRRHQEWPENVERFRPRPRLVEDRILPMQPLAPWTPARTVHIEPPRADEPGADEPAEDASDGSRFSLSQVRTSSLVIAAIVLILLGAVAHWVSNSGEDDGTRAGGEQPVASSPGGQMVVGEAPIRRIAGAPASVCGRFTVTGVRFESVTVSGQNTCQ